MTKIAVIRVRGSVNIPHPVAETLEYLRLSKVNNCVVVENTPHTLGMVRKVQHYLTYGEVDEATYQELVAKRGRIGKKKLDPALLKAINMKSSEELATKTYADTQPLKNTLSLPFKLPPPRKGWERKGIKKVFNVGGALGYRGAAINDLIKRMV